MMGRRARGWLTATLDARRRVWRLTQLPLSMRWILGVSCVVLAAGLVHGQQGGVFSVSSDLVVLHTTVTDRQGAFVGGLTQDSFEVREDDRVQTLEFFRQQDAPVTVGLVIDSSGSMLHNRPSIVAAVSAFAQSSHPDDEFFALVFNERVRPVLPQATPFTTDPVFLRDALASGFAVRGRTALYDAVRSAVDRIEDGNRERKVLIVLSDGGDNASRASRDDAFAVLQRSNVLVYTVALLDPLVRDGNPKLLRRMAETTGGRAFEPPSIERVGEALRQIGMDIRSSYTLAYVPTNAQRDGRLRTIRVTVKDDAGHRYRARTRAGYVAGARGAAVRDEDQ